MVVFIRHHLSDSLKSEYLRVDDPKMLWQSVHERFGHHKAVLLPKAEKEWNELRFQDFKSVTDYNSAMFKIVTILEFCGVRKTQQEMINKTLLTFNANDIIISAQYRNQNLTKYSELISLMLVAEQNNSILMNNHNSRPTGSKALHEANATESHQPPEANIAHRGGRGGYRGGRGGRGNYRGGRGGRGNYRGGRGGRGRNNFFPRNNNFKQRGQEMGKNEHGHKGNSTCHRCGMSGHWARTCRTAKHLADLYKASVENKGKLPEANFVNEASTSMPSLDVSDFFVDNVDNGDDLYP